MEQHAPGRRHWCCGRWAQSDRPCLPHRLAKRLAGPIAEIAAQRARNHERWGTKSIEDRPPEYVGWLPTLGEEYGEVCRALTLEGDTGALRAELIDVAATALMWVDSIDRALPDQEANLA